ncbi:MAG: hypothetical protein QF921_02315 [Pseudomonadales bacterium]|jgi:hypothetical protein|nr:hypothetical protein [Pseudomonadales bacterium]MDP6472213.1 hypothetical protein [Pseudomonadales bacterium]MDP6826535.1 hypothetical protein [Pseudomonadales bacterium]MDP6970343.1 hypothetical protein [Pseudomonadales bacterium]|tara:strand:- start:2886 stop:3077 length:192 start_codon:yes stop_codon:yes gene_type:complete
MNLIRLAGPALCFTAGGAIAASPTVFESFDCNYVGDNDRADLDRTLDLWSKKIRTIHNADLNQ